MFDLASPTTHPYLLITSCPNLGHIIHTWNSFSDSAAPWFALGIFVDSVSRPFWWGIESQTPYLPSGLEVQQFLVPSFYSAFAFLLAQILHLVEWTINAL